MRITDDKQAEVLALAARNVSLRDIAAQTGVYRDGVTAIIKKSGGDTSNVWSDEHGQARTEFLKEVWLNKQRFPAIELIAQELTRRFGRKVNKSQCMGKSRRLGLPLRGEEKTRKGQKRAAYQAGLPKTMTPAAQEARAAAVRAPYFTSALRLDPMPEEGITFEDLKPGMCKFALGAVREPVKFFCGEKAEGNYCARHQAIVWRPIPRRRFLKEAA